MYSSSSSSIRNTVIGIFAFLTMASGLNTSFKIDVHTHAVPDFYRKALVDAGYSATNLSNVFVDGFKTPEFDIKSYIDERVEHGYGFSVLSITAPGVSFLHGSYRAKEMARQLNLEMNGYRMAYPNQIGAFGILPLPDIQNSLDEIRYCLDELKFEGIGLYTNYDGVYLGDSSLDPILTELDRRGCPVLVHPTNPPEAPKLTNVSLPVIEYPFDTTRVITNLLWVQARKRFPNIKLIFSHGGGALPFLADRLAIQTTLPFHGGRDFNESMEELKSYYYDTAVVFGSPQIAALKEFVGADKLVTGSDCEFLTFFSLQSFDVSESCSLFTISPDLNNYETQSHMFREPWYPWVSMHSKASTGSPQMRN